jgi:hypothetical protein
VRTPGTEGRQDGGDPADQGTRRLSEPVRQRAPPLDWGVAMWLENGLCMSLDRETGISLGRPTCNLSAGLACTASVTRRAPHPRDRRHTMFGRSFVRHGRSPAYNRGVGPSDKSCTCALDVTDRQVPDDMQRGGAPTGHLQPSVQFG